MSSRQGRQTRTRTRLAKETKSRKKNNRKTSDKVQTNDESIVKVDPFLSTKATAITDYYSPPNLDENDIKIERLEGNFLCCWKLGAQDPCSKILQSPDDLINHLLNEHAQYGNKGYVCHWKYCSKRSIASYKTKSEFKGHLKIHTVLASFSDEEELALSDHDNVISDVNFEEKEDDEDSTDSDYMDSSDEEYNASKRKRKSSTKISKLKVKQKKMDSESIDSTNLKSKVLPKSLQVVSVLKEMSPIALSFYRFTCMWVVPFTMRGKNSTQQQNVICQRKFTVLEESIEHLQGHHVGKIKREEGTNKCLWKNCDKRAEVFESIDALLEHVLVHTEEKMISFNNNLMVNNNEAPAIIRTAKISPVIEKTKAKKVQITTSTSQASSIQSLTKKDSPFQKENDSWMVSILRLFLSAKVDTDQWDHITLCPSTQLCFFCRFCSLKNRLGKKDILAPYVFYEFTLEKERFKIFDRPTEFLDKLLDDLISHESVWHNEKVFSETFWVKCLISTPPTCTTHKLNKNLINLFPVLYKNCPCCTLDSQSWPTASHNNLIIKLDTINPICYPDLLMVKGKVYQLSAVVCEEDFCSRGNSYFTNVRVKNMWISYSENSCHMVSGAQVSGNRSACIVAYVAKTSLSDSKKHNPNAPFYEVEDCQEKQSPVIDCTDDVVDENLDSLTDDDDPSYTTPPPSKKMDEKLVSLFTCRQLVNDGNESCINSVLQAILQTGLATVVKELCPSTSRCYFCRMLSFTQRVICSSEYTAIKAFELVLHKKELGVADKEGNPAVYISNLISEIVADERAQHDSNDTKYKFMIRQKKIACSCMMSCEVYRWKVTPTKKNESLLDLMANCSMHCTQCNVMTTVQPIQMPDNLIVTIERSEETKDTCVHYPDEWASYNTRYFLSSIIVEDKKESKDSNHYYTYCKVFGKWMCYNDERITKASTSDVLGNKRACVLVYVTKELTPHALQDALADAQCYSFKRKGNQDMPVSTVKQEPLD